MRDLIDHHEREMMLDLTGERRAVPTMGLESPAEAEGGDSAGLAIHVRFKVENAISGPATQSHAGASEALRIVSTPQRIEENRP